MHLHSLVSRMLTFYKRSDSKIGYTGVRVWHLHPFSSKFIMSWAILDTRHGLKIHVLIYIEIEWKKKLKIRPHLLDHVIVFFMLISNLTFWDPRRVFTWRIHYVTIINLKMQEYFIFSWGVERSQILNCVPHCLTQCASLCVSGCLSTGCESCVSECVCMRVSVSRISQRHHRITDDRIKSSDYEHYDSHELK